MKSIKCTSGYTLLELMITILIGSIITLAATTILLLGLRLNNESTKTVTKQNTARIVLSALEDIATEGTIDKVDSNTSAWQVIDVTEDGETTVETVLFSYDSNTNTIYTGSLETGTPLLEDVIASHVALDKNGVLTFSVEMEDQTFSSSVFCRTTVVAKDTETERAEIQENVNIESIESMGNLEKQGRIAFLKKLASQYGSRGYIIEEGSTSLKYYSHWYIGDAWGSVESEKTWNASTPWCACFVSWAADGIKEYLNVVPKESHVSQYVEYIKGIEGTRQEYHGKLNTRKTGNPLPGDLIIFDWDKEEKNGPDHVGVVFRVDTINGEQIVYTIEGNSANMVAVRSYNINDPDIVGYGELDWKTDNESN